MPHQSLKLIPGVDVNKTPALNEAAISQSQLVRFIPDRTLGGLIQKLGGWTKFFPNAIGSVVRALWAWEDTNSNSYLAVGAEGIPASGGGALEVISAGNLGDITPKTLVVNVAVNASTTAGSNAVVITDTGRNISSYDSVDIQVPISIGGIVLFGLYQAYNPGGSANTYTVYALDGLGNPNIATSTTSGGAAPQFTTVSGSANVLVTLNNHGYVVGNTFPILVATVIRGITLYGNYIVNSVLTANAFTISASTSSVSTSFTTTGASGTGTVATLTFSSGYTIPVGSSIIVTGVTPTGYNGTYVVTASGTNTVSYANATTGVQTVAGSISAVSVSVYENSGLAHYVYYKGVGQLPAGTGYGIGGYGRGGYGTGNAPTLSPGNPINAIDWTLDNWGEVLISNPLNGPIYEWSPTTGQPLALVIPQAPTVNAGMFVAMPQRQIVAWGSTFNGIQDPLLIRWCDVNDYNQWTALITNQAGSYRIPKGSRIISGIQAAQQGLIWTDLGIWAMQYAGPPYVYQFNELGTGCGLIGRKAAGNVSGVVYWMGASQFYKLSGNGVEPIPCPIWDVVFQDLDIANLDRIRVAVNSRFGEIAWHFPTVGNGGENYGYVKYNYVLNQWDYGFNSTANPYVARSAWINESVLGPPIGAALNKLLYQHETSTDADGTAMDSYFQTGYFVLTEADVKMFIDQVWPDMKWGYYGGSQGANILLTFYVTDYPGTTPIAYGPFTLTQATTYITPRFRGRLVAIRIESNDIGSFWRLGNFRYRLQPDGRF